MGGSEIVVWVPPTVCQLCEEPGHGARACPYLRVRCKVPGCEGIMDLVIGVNEDLTEEEKFLKCEILSCPGIENISVTHYPPQSECPRCNPK